jgi:2-polyprenyl-3-methyl-5-hydroxy-6-metoxy-1,4-benzoquinol methylase
MTMNKDAAAPKRQDKAKEIAFFDRFATTDDYDVFMPEEKARNIDAVVRLGELKRGLRIADLGCGSGAFTAPLHERGFQPEALDISSKLTAGEKR